MHSFTIWYPRQESNLNLEFRKPFFYPLNYGDMDEAGRILPSNRDWASACRIHCDFAKGKRLSHPLHG